MKRRHVIPAAVLLLSSCVGALGGTWLALSPAPPPIATLDAGTDGPASMLAEEPRDRWAGGAVAIECPPSDEYNPACELQRRATP